MCGVYISSHRNSLPARDGKKAANIHKNQSAGDNCNVPEEKEQKVAWLQSAHTHNPSPRPTCPELLFADPHTTSSRAIETFSGQIERLQWQM